MIAVLLLVAMTGTQAEAHSTETRLLAPGAREERALAAGHTHTYVIDLKEGDFVRARVAPRGIDVAIALFGPDDRQMEVSDLMADTDAAETAMAVATQSGPHRLTVAAVKDKVPAGQYVISLDPPHPATAAETVRVDALRKLESGVPLLRQPERAARQRAAEQFEQSRTQFRESGDPAGESWALVLLAWTKNLLLSPDALDVARQAADLCRGDGDRDRLSTALNTLGLLRIRNGESAQGRDDLLESLALATAGGTRHATQEARAHNGLGILYGRTGEAERAVEEFRRALQLSRTIQWQELELGILNNLGIATKDLGEYDASLDYYAETLALSRALKDRGLQANVLNNMGNLYRIRRSYRKALECHEQALSLAREVGDLDHEGRALNTLGWTQFRLNDFRKALDYFEQALAIRQRVNEPAGLASTLDGVGMTWHALGDETKALEYMNEGLALRRSLAERYAEIESLSHLAQVKRDQGRLDEALADVEASVQLADSLRGRVMSPDLRASFVAAEQERYELYIDTLMQLSQERPSEPFATQALEASERGRARVLLESLIEARTDIRQGIDPALLEQERSTLRRLDEASTRLTQLTARQSDARAVEGARAAIATVSGEYQATEARIRRESPRYAALTQPVALKTAEIQERLLDADTVLLEFALGERRSWLWAVTPKSVESFALPPRGQIEEATRRVYTLLTARQPRAGEPATDRAQRVAAADGRLRRQSAALSRTLLGEAAHRLGTAWDRKRLLIVAADVLAYAPFSSLPDPKRPQRPLVQEHEIVSVPSASVLAFIREDTQGRRPAMKSVAILADPVFESDDPRVKTGVQPASARASGARRVSPVSRLPFSRQEALAIAALLPPSDVLRATDFDANRALATSGDLSDYRIVHFATHGFLNSEQPRMSGLVLSLVRPDGKAQEGFLRLTDIYNLRLPAEVVVLSACQTALGKEIRGEGIVGLTRGFMYAGARRVVASLWQVDDLATAELMRLFYRAMLKDGLRPAAALRAAQRQLAAQPQWASPYYWSAFVLQGEWK